MLDKNSILKIDDLKVKSINVPEWNDSVYIRQMSGQERAEFEEQAEVSSDKQSDQLKSIALLCSYVISDENGQRLFTNEEADRLIEKNFNALNRIYLQGMKFNAITSDDIEDIVKN